MYVLRLSNEIPEIFTPRRSGDRTARHPVFSRASEAPLATFRRYERDATMLARWLSAGKQARQLFPEFPACFQPDFQRRSRVRAQRSVTGGQPDSRRRPHDRFCGIATFG